MKTVLIQSQTETLMRLAAIHYADWTLWPAIRWASDYLSTEHGEDWWIEPPIGQIVIIPDLPDRSQRYIVQAGDTWESISSLHYGCEHFGDRIRNRNGGSHISDSVGQSIVIPALIATERTDRMAAT